ncbi:MAG: ribonuclease P protein component [Gammaproteobacteria bacterium]|nr:MAG: ribonuclease P protein component [Gammaproteobacteria bacterium]
MTLEHSFSKARRLKKASEFSAVYQCNQTRVKGQYFVVLAFSRFQQFANAGTSDIIPALPVGRVGVVVSKKVSKLAVRRNRIKRLIREQFRQKKHPDGVDFVVLAKPRAAVAKNRQLSDELNDLWIKLHKRCDTV